MSCDDHLLGLMQTPPRLGPAEHQVNKWRGDLSHVTRRISSELCCGRTGWYLWKGFITWVGAMSLCKKRLSLWQETYIRKIILICIGTDANDCIGTDVFLREHRRWGDLVGDMSSLLTKKCIGTDAKIHKDRHTYYIRTHVKATLSSWKTYIRTHAKIHEDGNMHDIRTHAKMHRDRNINGIRTYVNQHRDGYVSASGYLFIFVCPYVYIHMSLCLIPYVLMTSSKKHVSLW